MQFRGIVFLFFALHLRFGERRYKAFAVAFEVKSKIQKRYKILDPTLLQSPPDKDPLLDLYSFAIFVFKQRKRLLFYRSVFGSDVMQGNLLRILHSKSLIFAFNTTSCALFSLCSLPPTFLWEAPAYRGYFLTVTPTNHFFKSFHSISKQSG